MFTSRSCAIAFATLLTFPIFAAESDKGVRLGWSSSSGVLLLNELNCVACHSDSGSGISRWTGVAPKQAPRLGEVGGRVTPQYLKAFLSNPHQTKPGTTMPDLLHSLSAEKRDSHVDALVHFLVSLSGPIDQRSSGSSLTQMERGRDLYHTVGCVACHRAFDPPPKHKIDPSAALRRQQQDETDNTERQQLDSIPLGDLAMKTTVDALADFLEDPLHVRPSGRMPALNLQPGEARLIAAYLLRDQYSEKETAPGVGLDLAFYEGNWNKVPEFEKLNPKLETAAKSFDLKAIKLENGQPPKSNFAVRYQGLIDVPEAGEYRFWTKSDDGSVLFIDGKKVVDNDGIHAPQEKQGTVELEKGRHTFQVGVIQGGGGYELSVSWQPPGAKKRAPIPQAILLHSAAAMIPKGIVDFTPNAEKVQQGKALFASLGCASCHETSNKSNPSRIASTLKAKPWSELDSNAAKGCLSNDVAAGRPLYGLSDHQRTLLRQALTQSPSKASPDRTVEYRMAAMNCYACHQRDGKGGPGEAKSDYFAYETVVDFGDEGRLPPPLNAVGAKLTESGFETMLFEGQRYRTFMATRMPQYGKAAIGDLPQLFAKADEGKFPKHTPAFSSRLVDDGRLLAGKQKLACINCHAWNSLRLPGAEGLDLLQATKRLRPGWFKQWLLDPQQIRPGTRMPTSWPNGQSFFPDIQDGNVTRQIDAIWAYLSVGEKGGTPPGLSPDDKSLLVPADKPIVFRTFLDQVSAHAILVGFRQRTNVAFDANRVRMAVAWTGDFVSTKPVWDGRAGQYAKIRGSNVVRFAEGPPLARLNSLDDPWPSDVPKSRLGSTRTPPGWQFRGYRYNKNRIPTFLYSLGSIDIEETPGTTLDREAAVITRRFRLHSKTKPDNLYLRAAAGKITQQDEEFIVDNRERWRIVASGGATPQIRVQGNQDELIVPVVFTAAASDGYEAEVELELKW